MTEEQMQNAMLYGVCQTCGTPRERASGKRTKDGKTVMWSGIVYPCGHTGLENPNVGVDFTKSVRTDKDAKA